MVREMKIYGADRDLSDVIKVGDQLLLYVTKYYAKMYGGKIVAIMEVESDWFQDNTPIFPAERARNRAIYVYRIRLRERELGVCDLRSILKELSFVEEKDQLAKYLRRVPANLGRPIPERDVKVIQECMKEEEFP
ncbi:hypothetical protein HS1genome_0792 [Sulfodiicoccus acidiphilus]|uniref:EVE domain-containing protein n=1 Tax=Sulfodiicoccus acidiphilus TaxID=1670455 RepID=A0A348B2K1_9CREN|nr:hypothetical protein HS1genome_0792 [Sulfodiicoccus acidiphilus]GGT97383.1 hypothetical protein GCM10007116_13630 [Sulfodiicoccus acidiphilus]